SGLLSQQMKARFLEAGQDYVPYYRVVTDDMGKSSVKGSIFKRIRGSESNVGEILDNINKNSIMWIDAAMKNKAKLQTYDMIQRYGLDDVAERFPVSHVQKKLMVDKDMEKALSDLGMTNPGDAVAVF